MRFNRLIELDNGFTADIGRVTDVTIPCYRILVCVDINVTTYNEDINYLPCYLVIVPIKETYLSMKKGRFVVKEFNYEN